jgi:hypothetical protein
MFHKAWIPFIDRERKKRKECRLCHVRFDGLDSGMEDMRWLVAHVIGAHELGSEALVARRLVVGVVV